jgi:hypothetical protein
LRLAASAAGAEVVGQKALSLDEIFLAQVGQPGQPGQPPSPSQEA